MDEKRVTGKQVERISAEQIMSAISSDVELLAQQMAEAINNAEYGAIIDQSEEEVQDAHAEMRKSTYQKALHLLADNQQAFSPRMIHPEVKWKNKGKQKVSYLSVNGRLDIVRTVYWNPQRGSVMPMDVLLGITQDNYSVGIREMTCLESLDHAFAKTSKNLKRLAQVDISPNVIRQIVEQEGAVVHDKQCKGQFEPEFTSSDCTENTVISGTDGVMVPLVTESQKNKRRETEAVKRKREKRKSAARAYRPRKGSDGPYKEFKVVSFYDKDKSHQHVAGTSGNCQKAGRLLRKIGTMIDIENAKTKYSVSDGASWIENQYQTQLPMLDANILDYYHFKEHITLAGQTLYGQGSKKARQWKEDMMDIVKNNGSLVLLDRLKECYDNLDDEIKQEELRKLRQYICKRIHMTDYPEFIQRGYDIGSGPTESLCGRLTDRLKGPGMKWEKDNAEALMALTSICYSNLWDKYWKEMRKGAA